MLPGFNVKVKLLLSSIWVFIYFEHMQKVQKKYLMEQISFHKMFISCSQ